jgi:hypothetical protein
MPETRGLTQENLNLMLQSYGMVYVKPDRGRYGRGVMRIDLLTEAGPHFQLRCGRRSRVYTSWASLAKGMRSMQVGRNYLVQQGIHALQHEGRPFDIRVMVQRSPSRQWKTTGYIARVAAPRSIVTNFHSGGTPATLEPVLAHHVAGDQVSGLISRLCLLGETVAARLHASFPGLTAVGLDIALDQDLNPWILEVNTRPLADLFARLKDKTMFRRMCRYAKAVGDLRPKRRKR